jgi:hypothetical protein
VGYVYSYPETVAFCELGSDGEDWTADTQCRQHPLNRSWSRALSVGLGWEHRGFSVETLLAHNQKEIALYHEAMIDEHGWPEGASHYPESQAHTPQRPFTARPHSAMQNRSQPLRRRASFESQAASRPWTEQDDVRRGLSLWTSAHHEQVQMQWASTVLGPGGEQRPPHVLRWGSHHRGRSVGSQMGSTAPYRVLHSYYTPAYRHVPIWG